MKSNHSNLFFYNLIIITENKFSYLVTNDIKLVVSKFNKWDICCKNYYPLTNKRNVLLISYFCTYTSRYNMILFDIKYFFSYNECLN